MVLFLFPFLQDAMNASFGTYAKSAGYIIAAILALVATIFMAKDTDSVANCKTDKLVSGLTSMFAVIVYIVTVTLL